MTARRLLDDEAEHPDALRLGQVGDEEGDRAVCGAALGFEQPRDA